MSNEDDLSQKCTVTNTTDTAAIGDYLENNNNMSNTPSNPTPESSPNENPHNNQTENGDPSTEREQAIHRELLDMTGAEWIIPDDASEGVIRQESGDVMELDGDFSDFSGKPPTPQNVRKIGLVKTANT